MMQHQYNLHKNHSIVSSQSHHNSIPHYVMVQQLKILAKTVDVNDNGIETYGLNNFLL